jgi:hypothetical protein
MSMTLATSAPTQLEFSSEAVSVYGSPQATCDRLAYMDAAREELNAYLAAYPLQKRYGGAVSIRGEHGAGKTHLLNWLRETASGTRFIRPTVLYAKCDTTSLFDLHQNLMSRLSREDFLGLVQEAVVVTARMGVLAAEATESLAGRIERVGDLASLDAEDNLDVADVRQQLLAELRDSIEPMAFTLGRVLFEVGSDQHGEDAYRWFCAHDVERPERFGMPYSLRDLRKGAAMDEPAREAIVAMEIVAALHRIVGRPLVLLVDQLEVLVRVPSRTARETLSSLLKKLVEQAGRQHALLFIAGMSDAWTKLTRDVLPRFRNREPMPVGGLTRAETELFLEWFLAARQARNFPSEATGAIHNLSGGSPREIIRISTRVYEAVNGNVRDITVPLILDCARKAGTMYERATLALATTDSVFAEFGTAINELGSGGANADRALLAESGEVIAALIVIKASDAVDEIDSAKRVSDVSRFLDDSWPHADLLVVTVGYSSAEVSTLLATVASPFIFDEKTFEADLRARVLEQVAGFRQRSHERVSPAIDRGVQRPDIAESATPESPGQTSGSGAEYREQLEQLQTRLIELEGRRAGDASRNQTRFVEQAIAVNQREVDVREKRTKWEMLGLLDELTAAQLANAPEQEQQLINAILVSNELYVRRRLVEELGGSYLDALNLLRMGPSEWRRDQLESIRRELAFAMRAELRRSHLFTQAGRYSPSIFIVSSIAAIALQFADSSVRSDIGLTYLRLSRLSLAILGVSAAYWWILQWYIDTRRARRFTNRIRKIQEAV